MKKLIIILLTLVVGGAGFWVWRDNLQSSNDYSEALSYLVSEGRLTVGTDPTYPPMESVNENGEMIGFDIDLARMIAEKLEVEFDMRHVIWDDLFVDVDEKKLDLAISSISITSERSKKMLFSNPYLNAGQVVITIVGSGINEVEDIRDKNIGAYYDTTSEDEARKFSDAILPYEDSSEMAVKRLRSGEYDAIVVDFTAGVEMTRGADDVVMVGEPFTSEFYGVVTQLENKEFILVVNNILAELKADGSMKKLEDTWFNN